MLADMSPPGPAWHCGEPSLFARVIDLLYSDIMAVIVLPSLFLLSLLFFCARYFLYDRKEFGNFTLFSAPAFSVAAVCLFLFIMLAHFLIFDSLDYDDLITFTLVWATIILSPITTLLYAIGFFRRNDRRWIFPFFISSFLLASLLMPFITSAVMGPSSVIGKYPSRLFCSEWVYKEFQIPQMPVTR